MILNKRQVVTAFAAVATLGAMVFSTPVWAEDEAPDALIKRLSVDVLDTIKADKAIRAGDMARVVALVDSRIMPNVNFQRMTASAVGPGWRQATPEQQKRLQDEFKILLVRTYAGALAQVSDQTIAMKPLRAAPLKPQWIGMPMTWTGLPSQTSGRIRFVTTALAQT